MTAAYILIYIAAASGLLDLVKDWKEHKTKWRRLTVFLLIIAALIVSHVALRSDERERTQGKTEIEKLTARVETANKNQGDNTKIFLSSLKDLNGQVQDLKTQVKTAKLQEEVKELERKLQEIS